jgi:hypothetical protein
VTFLWGDALPKSAERRVTLMDRFVVPPFSILDARQGYWQDRKRAWLSLGIKSELGRGAGLMMSNQSGLLDIMAQRRGKGDDPYRMKTPRSSLYDTNLYRHKERGDEEATERAGALESGTSIFDPVLCELVYRWWCPAGGAILDPFAGGSVRGVVAAFLGHPYTGIDLSEPQIEANRVQASEIVPGAIQPTWHVGDSRNLQDIVPAGEMFDLVFSCPPYYDLEVYSDDPADLSRADTYEEFLEAYTTIIEHASSRLRDDRFFVLVVSDVRNASGSFHGLPVDTVNIARRAGLGLFTEGILVSPAGSLPVRVSRNFDAGMILGRSHQNVLVFLKGDRPRDFSHERAAPPKPQLVLWSEG